MSEDHRDMAYKLWLLPPPFLIQQPTSFPPVGTQAAHSVMNNGNQIQIPTNKPLPLPLSINGLDSSIWNSSSQQRNKQSKKSVDPLKNGSSLSKLLSSETRSPLSTERIKMSSHSPSTDFIQFGGQDMPEIPKTVCQTCGKWFRSRQQLTQHLLVHTDVRKYQCNFCGRAFKQPSHLQQHHRIHTGEKPYRCPLPGCSRAFPQLSNLNHHLRNHDKPDPPSQNTCTFCSRTYASEAVLKNHVFKIHMCKTSKEDVTNDPNNITSTATSNQANPSMNHFGDIIPKVTKNAELKDSLLAPIKCAPPQHLDSSCYSSSIIWVPNKDMIPGDGKGITITADSPNVYNTIPMEKIRQRTNDEGEILDMVKGDITETSVSDLKTNDITKNIDQSEYAVDKHCTQITTAVELDHRDREASKINKKATSLEMDVNDKAAIASEYWIEANGLDRNGAVNQHSVPVESVKGKEYAVSQLNGENFIKNRGEKWIGSSATMTNQGEIMQTIVDGNETVKTAVCRDNYNYTLEFLEHDLAGLEKRLGFKEASYGSKESVSNENNKTLTRMSHSIEGDKESVVEKPMNHSKSARPGPFGTQMCSYMPVNVCKEIDDVENYSVNDIPQEYYGEEYHALQNACKFAKMTEMDAIQEKIGRNGSGSNDYPSCLAVKQKRESTSRKRKAFQPQRVVYNEDMTGF